EDRHLHPGAVRRGEAAGLVGHQHEERLEAHLRLRARCAHRLVAPAPASFTTSWRNRAVPVRDEAVAPTSLAPHTLAAGRSSSDLPPARADPPGEAAIRPRVSTTRRAVDGARDEARRPLGIAFERCERSA